MQFGFYRAIMLCVSKFWAYNIGMSPSGKAPDFDSGIRRFKSCHPSQQLRGSISLSYDPLAQLAEQLPFKQWVWSSNLQRVTIKKPPLSGWFFYGSPRDSNDSNATPRWGVAATSANTGGYYNFCLWQKCKRICSGSRPEGATQQVTNQSNTPVVGCRGDH